MHNYWTHILQKALVKNAKIAHFCPEKVKKTLGLTIDQHMLQGLQIVARAQNNYDSFRPAAASYIESISS